MVDSIPSHEQEPEHGQRGAKAHDVTGEHLHSSNPEISQRPTSESSESASQRQTRSALEALTRQQAVVVHLGQQALARKDLDELLQEAVALLADVCGVPYCYLLELLPGNQEFLLRAGVNWQERFPVGGASFSAVGDSEAQHTLLSKEPVTIKDLRTETRFNSSPLLAEHDVLSGMLTSIPGPQQPFGVLGIFTPRRRPFTNNERDFLQSVANVLAGAIDRRLAEQALRQQNRQLRLLSQLATELLAAEDPEQMVEELFQNLSTDFGIDAGFNYMVHREGKELRLKAYIGVPEEEGARIERLRFGRAICGVVAATRQPLYVSHVQDSELQEAQVIKRYGIRAYACQPLMIGEQLVGTLSFGTRRRDFFSDQELSFFRTISLYVSLAKERLRAEKELRESEERYRKLIRRANDGVLVYQLSREGRPGTFVEANDVICERLGYSRQEFRGMSIFDIADIEDNNLKGDLERLKREHRLVVEAVHQTRDGRQIPTEVSAQLFKLHGKPTVLLICRDITERKQAEQALRESQTRLQAINETLEERVQERTAQVRTLAAQLEQAEQEERSRLARELHDSAGQLLTALLVNLQLLEGSVRQSDEPLWERIREVRELAGKAHEEIRTVSHALRPPALDLNSLSEALKILCSDIGQQTALQIEYHESDVPPLPEHVTMTFYRFLQEGLANVIRHAQTRNVEVRLRYVQQEVILEIKDDGVGFSVAEVVEKNGVGLQNVRERFQLIGGQVEINSSRGEGTRIIGRYQAEKRTNS